MKSFPSKIKGLCEATWNAAKARLRIERAESGMCDPELVRVPAGEFIGTLTWQDASSQIRRWTVRQGLRANNVTVEAFVVGHPAKRHACTWTAFLARLRSALSLPRRVVLDSEPQMSY